MILVFVFPFSCLVNANENTQTESAIIKIGEERITYAAHTLSWYSSYNVVGYWTTTPTVYLYYVDGNSSFITAMERAVVAWETALGININCQVLTNKEQIGSVPGIYYLGGTYIGLIGTDKLDDAVFFENGYLLAGLTLHDSFSYDGITYITTSGKTVTARQQRSTRGYIMDNNSNDLSYNYLNTCIHELGHALGWLGHSYNPNDVMYASNSPNTYITYNDKWQIKQMYDLWY